VPDGWAHLSTTAERGQVVVAVANSGQVIPPDQVAGLLEPFRRLGTARTGDRGAGLGLSIVAAIARAHGGTLTLHPRTEGGLDVRVALPVVGVLDSGPSDVPAVAQPDVGLRGRTG
jgi:signal transduction histidine kinase